MQEEMVMQPKIPQGEHKKRNNKKSTQKLNSSRQTSNNGKSPEKKPPYQRETLRLRMIKKFSLIVGTIVGVFLIAGTIAIFAIDGGQSAFDAARSELSYVPEEFLRDDTAAEEVPEATEMSAMPLARLKTNFLLVGKDDGDFLTDVILVGSFDRESHQITIISIPRDTYTVIPQTRVARMRELGLFPPSNGVMKMNAVNAFGQSTYGIPLLMEQLQDLLTIEIHYYIDLDLQGFRNIVDSLGGVYIDVPQRMFYVDPYQDLTIDLQPGFQALDGETAEGLVRFRTYRDGDLQRINMQQEFMKALFSQVLERENIIRNAYNVTRTVLGYTETNFSLVDIPRYIRYVDDLCTSKISFYTLPNYPQYINGISYVIPIEDEIRELVERVFFTFSESIEETVPEVEEDSVAASSTHSVSATAISSVGKRIQVLNGSMVSGLAGVIQEKLEADGFTVSNIDTFSGSRMEETRITVREAGMGEDLQRYFNDSTIDVVPNMPGNFDIIIITGIGEA